MTLSEKIEHLKRSKKWTFSKGVSSFILFKNLTFPDQFF